VDETGQPGSATPAESGNGASPRADRARFNGGWAVDTAWSQAGDALEPGTDPVVPPWRRAMDDAPRGWNDPPSRYADLLAPPEAYPPVPPEPGPHPPTSGPPGQPEPAYQASASHPPPPYAPASDPPGRPAPTSPLVAEDAPSAAPAGRVAEPVEHRADWGAVERPQVPTARSAPPPERDEPAPGDPARHPGLDETTPASGLPMIFPPRQWDQAARAYVPANPQPNAEHGYAEPAPPGYAEPEPYGYAVPPGFRPRPPAAPPGGDRSVPAQAPDVPAEAGAMPPAVPAQPPAAALPSPAVALPPSAPAPPSVPSGPAFAVPPPGTEEVPAGSGLAAVPPGVEEVPPRSGDTQQVSAAATRQIAAQDYRTEAPGESAPQGLPQRVPAEPDVPTVPEPPAADPLAETPELARIATHLRRDDVPPQQRERPAGFDVAVVLGAVRGVAGVRDASLRTNPGGGHTLRLDLADGADPARVSREVARLLQERMGLAAAPRGEPWFAGEHWAPYPPVRDGGRYPDPTVQTRRWPPPSTARGRAMPYQGSTGPAYQEPIETTEQAPPPRPLNRGGRQGPRVVIDHVQASTLGLDANVEVRLAAGDRQAVGLAEGPSTESYVLRLCAVATASAVDDLLREADSSADLGRCFVEHASVVPMGGCDVAVVVVLLVCGGWVERLAGSAVVDGDVRQAVVRATLAAVNRRLEALLV
jgi:hypothetical protein